MCLGVVLAKNSLRAKHVVWRDSQYWRKTSINATYANTFQTKWTGQLLLASGTFVLGVKTSWIHQVQSNVRGSTNHNLTCRAKQGPFFQLLNYLLILKFSAFQNKIWKYYVWIEWEQDLSFSHCLVSLNFTRYKSQFGNERGNENKGLIIEKHSLVLLHWSQKIINNTSSRATDKNGKYYQIFRDFVHGRCYFHLLGAFKVY